MQESFDNDYAHIYVPGPGFHNAYINYCSDRGFRWSLYAEGYKEAGNILLKSIAHAPHYVDMNKIDFLIYPITFLYHHYIELKLKQIYTQASELLDKEIKKDDLNTHNVSAFWKKKCKNLIKEVYKESDEAPLHKMDSLINYIATFQQF